jgi:hypothetical protein
MPSDPWPFDQAANVAAVTTRRVIDEGLPIVARTRWRGVEA